LCNAWNHPSKCTCGWGGEGHAGRKPSSFSNTYPGVPEIIHSYESYTNPNAFCPVCGDPVFFYQAANGGRVFFDELGPPWPKHACMDNDNYPKLLKGNPARKIKQYSWQNNGWSPLLIDSISRIDNDFTKIVGDFNNQKLTLYVNLKRVRGTPERYKKECLWQVKSNDKASFHLSVINGAGIPISKVGYISHTNAMRNKQPKRSRITNKSRG
jgi:hypothetical protein